MRKICFIITSRAHYGRLKSVLRAVDRHPKLQLQLVVGASALLRNYGGVIDVVKQDGFKIDSVFYSVVEGENPITMAKTTGLAILELTNIFNNLEPDMVFLHADRYEVIAAAISASYMNIMVAHNQGGEVSGTIDEHARHAITKLAHLHFTANKSTAHRIIKMGEREDSVHVVGCPSLDLIKEIDLNLTADLKNSLSVLGVGTTSNFNQPYLLVIYHPVTTDYNDCFKKTQILLEAVHQLSMSTIWFWPNVDAGSDQISKAIREFREKAKNSNIHFLKNLSPEDYLRILNGASCCLGNSSSFIREGSFLGVPAVIVGDRQTGRERGENALHVECNLGQITEVVQKQLNHGRYEPKEIYGCGEAAVKIADVLAETKIIIQKSITY